MPVAQLDRASDFESFSDSNTKQSEPTKPKKSLANAQGVFGLSCNLSAGVFGQNSDSNGLRVHTSPVSG